MALKDGINHLPVSFLARHIFDNIKDRLIKGDAENYMVLFSSLAEDLNVSTDEIAEAVLELRAQSLICLTVPAHNALIGFRLSRFMFLAEPVTLGSSQPPQKKLTDVPAEPKKTREELGRDEAVVDGRKTFGRLDATGGADQPFELTITQWPLKDGVEDPFGEDEVKVDKLPFGSKAEAWKFFDEWTTIATSGREMTPELAAAGATPPPPPAILAIAKACHEANREYCLSIGDDSQLPWDEAPEWQKTSAINGVQFALANPDVTPAQMHENWSKEKVADGWVYGETKDVEAKTHPCLVPYDQLPAEQQAKDILFQQTVGSMLGAPPAAPGDLPRLINENEFYTLSVSMIDGEIALEFLSNNELKPFDLSVFLAGQESDDYVVSEVVTYASGPNFAGKNPEWPMQELEAHVREALAFALARVATPPPPETPAAPKRGGRKAKPAAE